MAGLCPLGIFNKADQRGHHGNPWKQPPGISDVTGCHGWVHKSLDFLVGTPGDVGEKDQTAFEI